MDEFILDKLQKENKKLASLGKRLIATFIDNIILSILLFVILHNTTDIKDIVSGLNEEQISQFISSLSMYFIVIKFIYLYLFFYLKFATLGNIITKTKIVSIDNFESIDYKSSLCRALVFIICEITLFGILFLSVFFNSTNRHLADTMSKSVVINDD